MVGLNSYGTITFNNLDPSVGLVLPGSYNVSSATQDPANVNACLLRINFSSPFLYPPVLTIQPVRIGIQWESPGADPFMPDGANIQREVFPMPPAEALDTDLDEAFDTGYPRVYESGALPAEGRPMPQSSRVEMEHRLLRYRIMFVERTYFTVQFASFIGKIIEFTPRKLDGTLGTDDKQHGAVTEIMFNFQAAGDLVT